MNIYDVIFIKKFLNGCLMLIMGPEIKIFFLVWTARDAEMSKTSFFFAFETLDAERKCHFRYKVSP